MDHVDRIEPHIDRIERLESYVGIAIRDLKYATNPKSLKRSTEEELATRAATALKELASASAELTMLALKIED
jgi:hypothetical protein